MSAGTGAADFLGALRKRILRTDAVDTYRGGHVGELDLHRHVEKISCPALVVGGDRDPVIPVTPTRELAGALGERLWRLDLPSDWGHLAQRDNPSA